MMPNPRKDAVAQILERAEQDASATTGVLADVVSALEAGAWVGGLGDDFAAELGGHESATSGNADGVVEDVAAALESVPDEVVRPNPDAAEAV